MGALTKTALIRFLSIAATALLLSAARAPHPGPPVYLEVEIAEGVVRCTLTGEQATLLPWLGIEAPITEPMDAASRRRVLEAAQRFLEAEQPVLVDRERLPLILEDADTPESHRLEFGMPVIQFTFRFECQGTPRSVRIAWSRFRGPGWPAEEPAFPVCFKSGRHVRHELIYEDEPEFVWHRPVGVRARSIDVQAVTTTERAELAVPLPSTLLILGVVASLFVGRRLWSRTATLARLGAAALAFLLWNVGVVTVPDPLSSRAAVPQEAEAVAMFETLHGNIYRAFDALSEDQIYDLLAVSVDREILDDLYGEVYESLVMRRERGAICKIDRVEILGRELEPAEAVGETPQFSVNWRWRVHCSVTHWGHQHRRINRYHARYRVRHDGESWKIGGVKILDHERVDE